MPRLAVEWKASEGQARGFYHPDEERLDVCLDRPGSFAHFLDGERVSFDLDLEGALLGITVEAAREAWEVRVDLLAPRIGIPATVRFLDASGRLGDVRLQTDPDRTMLRIALSDLKAVHILELCEGLLLEVGEHAELVAVWVLDLVEDYGGRRQQAWRSARRRP